MLCDNRKFFFWPFKIDVKPGSETIIPTSHKTDKANNFVFM